MFRGFKMILGYVHFILIEKEETQSDITYIITAQNISQFEEIKLKAYTEDELKCNLNVHSALESHNNMEKLFGMIGISNESVSVYSSATGSVLHTKLLYSITSSYIYNFLEIEENPALLLVEAQDPQLTRPKFALLSKKELGPPGPATFK